jgi:ectoine hydroxylase-related dioxygenase (phytanoyl-CoA dioxygenase family)
MSAQGSVDAGALSGDALASHVERMRRDGYTIVEDAIEPALLDELGEAVARLERELEVAPAENIFEGRKTLRVYNLLARGEVFAKIPVHPKILPIVERVLDSGCLVSSLSSIGILPGELAQPLHADDQLIPLPKPHVPIICNTMWALTNFTEDNGATRVLPGSHQRDGNPPLGAALPTIPAVMRRGSVLVFDGSIWHGGGENRTGARRTGLAMNYCAGWVRQQENQQLGIPLEVARGFAPRLRKLCGFGLYRGLLGHIDKCSPVDLLDGGPPRPVVGVIGKK